MTHGKCNGWYADVYSADQCRVCWNRRDANTKRYNADAPVTTVRSLSINPRVPLSLVHVQPCAHRGDVQRRPSNCRKTWVYECDVFGECNLAKCENCSAFVTEVSPSEWRKHLCYYIYPVASDDGKLWRRAVENITSRLNMFNGRRIVAIATSSERHRLDPPEIVRQHFGYDDADFMYVPHGIKKLGEVTAFVPMLSRLTRFTSPNDVTFYAHTKGVTKPLNNPAVHRWADLMYRSNLDRWDIVAESLRNFPITGAFRKIGLAFGGRVARHYTGTFYWFRNADVFARDWRNVPARYGGTEMFPGLLFNAEECGCHFYEATGKILYDSKTVDDAEKSLCLELTTVYVKSASSRPN